MKRIPELNNIKEIEKLSEPIKLNIFFNYPELPILWDKKPKERAKIIRQAKRDGLKAIVSKLRNNKYTIIGKKFSPYGIKYNATKIELKKFSRNKLIKYMFISKNEKEESKEQLFCFIVRFMIQVENIKKGMQTYEDRTILIKAKNNREAENRILKAVPEYEEPYLNFKGELVRWKFEKVMDSYETIYNNFEEMKKEEKKGIEVFSVLRSRRLNNSRIWNKEYNDK